MVHRDEKHIRQSLSHVGFIAALTVMLVLVSNSGRAVQLEVSGITEPLYDVLVGAVDTGVIDKINFKEGIEVKLGDTLFSLEHSLEQFEVDRRRIVMEDRAELDSAIAKVKTLQILFSSNKELYDLTKSVSKEELDSLELQLLQSEAEQKRLESAEIREVVEWKIAKQLLQRKIIKAPIDGVITKIFFNRGEIYEVPKPVIRLVMTRACLFVCNVKERVGRRLKLGSVVSLKITTGDQMISKKGVIKFVSPVVDPASWLLEVKVEFSNKDGKVRPGIAGIMQLDI